MKLSEKLKEFLNEFQSGEMYDLNQDQIDAKLNECIAEAKALEATQPLHQMAQKAEDERLHVDFEIPENELPKSNDKNVIDWLTQIEDEVVRNYATLNAEKANNLLQPVGSLAEAIELGFEWDKNDQGIDYWLDVYNKYIEQ